nr:hypothetical protein BaRGS_000756 [Batillaria attramentaria]
MKTAALNKTSSVEAKEEKEKTSVPAWRANLGQKKRESDIKIELIESNSSTPASVASGGPKKEDASKTQDSPSKTAAGNKEVQSDQCRGSATSRSSKVLDLVKNFQNLQVS